MNTCSTCTHFTKFKDDSGIGTCSKGGPDPSQGCSDVGENETCEKYLDWLFDFIDKAEGKS